MRKNGIIVLCCFILCIAGCSNSGKKEDATVSMTDGVAKFDNENYTLAEILDICDNALIQKFDLSDNCEIYETYVYTDKDGRLLTEYESEFEIILTDKDTGKWFCITADNQMKQINICQTSEREKIKETDIMSWNEFVHLTACINYTDLIEQEDFYIDMSIIGQIKGTEIQIDPERDALYLLQSDKLVETSKEELKGEYGGLILSYCENDGGKTIDRDTGHTLNHMVVVLE